MNGASLLQAARGPIVLITLGALFLLHQNTEHSFARTFPVLLIVFGVMRLLEHFASKNEPDPVAAYGVAGPAYPNYTPGPLTQHPPAAPPMPPPSASPNPSVLPSDLGGDQ